MTVKEVKGYEILDSRGTPTVCARVTLNDGTTGWASVPSGASTGEHEAVELRDKNPDRYFGKGVLEAVINIDTKISPCLRNIPVYEQAKIDNTMIEADGTDNKSNFGANAILAVSLACARAAAAYYDMPLYRYIGGASAHRMPVPMMNILNGGAHASNNVDIQEFMLIPKCAPNFHGGLRMCAEIYHKLGELLKQEGYSTSVGDEGGYAPDLSDDTEAIEWIIRASEACGYSRDDIFVSLDVASSEWANDGKYHLPKRKVDMTGEGLTEYLATLTEKYPIFSIEDGMGENDVDGWKKLTERLGKSTVLVGDDLFVTNQNRLKEGIKNGIANCVLIKPNQIGTLTETIECVITAKEHGYKTIISHRSGETDDTFIADLAVALNTGLIKTGAPCRMDRVSKYNRLLMIEDDMLRNYRKLSDEG